MGKFDTDCKGKSSAFRFAKSIYLLVFVYKVRTAHLVLIYQIFAIFHLKTDNCT